MTTRRDKNVRGGSVITGFRMEPDLAQRLTEYARRNLVVNDKADIAAAARYLLRTQLGKPSHESLDPPGGLTESTRGMKMEKWLVQSIGVWIDRQDVQLSFVGAIRHLIRLGLGYNAKLSLQRESKFAELSALRQQIASET